MPRKQDRLIKKLKKQRRVKNAYALANWITGKSARKKKRERR